MDKSNSEKLDQDLKCILEESRVVIPGVQALLGFQFVAVFNQLFPKELTHEMQIWHTVSLVLTTIAMILIMSPASYHRLGGHKTTQKLIDYSSHFLMTGMFVLSVGICIDFDLIACVILQ